MLMKGRKKKKGGTQWNVISPKKNECEVAAKAWWLLPVVPFLQGGPGQLDVSCAWGVRLGGPPLPGQPRSP